MDGPELLEEGGDAEIHGPDAESRYVTLVSHDGHNITIPLGLALYSRTIAVLLRHQHPSTPDNVQAEVVVRFPAEVIKGPILEEVVRYMRFRRQWNGRQDAPQFEIEPSIVRDLALAADYLDL